MKLIQLVLLLVPLVSSQPYDGFPINEQLPDVARVNEPYSFQIANDTFLSDVSEVAYSVENLPSWLSFDASSRLLTGTPSSDDVSDDIKFTLIGTDADSSITREQPLVVSESTGPEPSDEFTVLSQLAEIGQTNGVNGLVLSPGEIFNVTFDSKTFTSDDSVVTYYGRSSDRTPLPNWLFFDSANLRFSGVAPAVNSQIAPGFEYSFIFIATDYTGFTGSFVEFRIVVGAHSLTTTLKDVININGSAGDALDYDLPLESVYSDGVPITAANISNIELSGNPNWLSLSDNKLVGTVPEDYEAENETFNVTIYDLYSNAVSLYFQIESIDSLFAVDSFRSVNATRGSYFQYYFLPSDFTDYSSTNVSVDTDQDWLSFHSSNLTINGETPDDFDSADIKVIASSENAEDELSFKVYGIDPIVTDSSSSSSSRSSSRSQSSSSTASSTSETASATSAEATASATATPATTTSKKSSNKKALAIGLGVGIPVFALLVAACLIFLCCFRKRKQDEENTDSSSPTISKPILGNPANGPTSRSPNGFSTPSTQSPEKDGWSEPKRLSTLNVLKLDEKEFYEHSSSSSTNVGSFDAIHDETHSSLYQDALQAQSTDQLMNSSSEPSPVKDSVIPRRSWRQTVDSRINRESLNSLATVSTNELLSIRLADDNDIKRDPRKSNLGFRDSAFLGSTASSILTRDDSGNIQRLDSDGNIVEQLNSTRQRASRATELDILQEEMTPRPPQEFSHDTSFSSTSSGDGFYPVNTSNGGVQWEYQDRSQFSFENESKNTSTPQGKPNKARLVDFKNKGRADTTNDTTQSTGETAEIESV